MEYLTTDELARELKVSTGTVRRWVIEGRIPEVRLTPKVRRFRLAEVLEALQRREACCAR